MRIYFYTTYNSALKKDVIRAETKKYHDIQRNALNYKYLGSKEIDLKDLDP